MAPGHGAVNGEPAPAGLGAAFHWPEAGVAARKTGR
jgi:hypothetical protein